MRADIDRPSPFCDWLGRKVVRAAGELFDADGRPVARARAELRVVRAR